MLLVASPAGYAQGTATSTNVALGKTFTCSSPGGIAWQGLLDGKKSSDSPPGCFATGPEAEYPKKVVVDLGAVYLIDQVIVYNSSNGNTKQVEVWAARDGVNYTQLRQPYIFPNKVAQSMSARFPALEARYVKLALRDTYGGGLGGDHALYLREVEVMGREVPATSATKQRPKLPDEPPRLARIFRRYVLSEGARVRMLVIGDDTAAAREGGQGLAGALASKLGEEFRLESVDVDDHSRSGMTARRAVGLELTSGEAVDLVVVALGTMDALAFDPASFRAAMERLFERLLDRTDALVVAVAPPRIPRSPELGRADECGSADTADTTWQIAGLLPGTGIAIVDGDAAIQASGRPAADVYADNLSLSRSGHDIIAAAIVKMLKKR